MNDRTKFTIEVDMPTRWVPHFLGMLKLMQRLGGLGSSRKVSFYSDGDGDFRPKFNWDSNLPSDGNPTQQNDEFFFDAG